MAKSRKPPGESFDGEHYLHESKAPAEWRAGVATRERIREEVASDTRAHLEALAHDGDDDLLVEAVLVELVDRRFVHDATEHDGIEAPMHRPAERRGHGLEDHEHPTRCQSADRLTEPLRIVDQMVQRTVVHEGGDAAVAERQPLSVSLDAEKSALA